MGHETDVCVTGARVYFLPVTTRVPLKFGAETLTHVTCVRARVRVRSGDGRTADGWGETPLSVQWAWPGAETYEARHRAMQSLCLRIGQAWSSWPVAGHPLEIGYRFLEGCLPELLEAERGARPDLEPMPWLAALICSSAFDLALHDAYGQARALPVYETYGGELMAHDLAAYLEPAAGSAVQFGGRYPCGFLSPAPPRRLPAWHLVGGRDPVSPDELTGDEPDDGYPVLLRDWIRRDGLRCLKVKLRGDDDLWDYGRLVAVGEIGLQEGAIWLSADFNCTVRDPAYVTEILDRLMTDHPRIYQMILYVEQPFPYDLERHPIDVRSVSARKPLFLDESAHDWRLVRMGRELGWTGVALKTCKTQTGALLSLAWARAHGMTLMVQDLTNPMLAQIPHVLLAAHAGTIMGVETNAMQFYPEASAPEARVHPGLYRRHEGCVDWTSVRGTGFGYRLDEIERELPPAAGAWGELA